MAKTARCKDTGRNCEFVIQGATDEELLTNAAYMEETPTGSENKERRSPAPSARTSFHLCQAWKQR